MKGHRTSRRATNRPPSVLDLDFIDSHILRSQTDEASQMRGETFSPVAMVQPLDDWESSQTRKKKKKKNNKDNQKKDNNKACLLSVS